MQGIEYGNDIFLRCIDYSINLMSDNSEKILNFDRNHVKDNYRLQLNELVRKEKEIMIGKVVPYLLKKKPELSDELAVEIYQAARQLGKGDELLNIYKNKLEEIEIGGYRNLDNKKKSFKASELIGKTLFFVRIYDKNDNSKYPDMEDEDNKKKKILENQYLKMDSLYAHSIDYKIINRYIKEIRGKLYEVIESEAYSRQDKNVYQMDSFFKHEEMLLVMFANRRCITTWRGYENLETFVNLGLSISGSGTAKQIEMQMNPQIRDQMRKELEEKGYIENCCEKYMDAITKSVEYNHNISYILRENENEDRDGLIEKYKSLWKEELKLLEDERFKEFTINKIKRIKKDIEAGRLQYYDTQFGGYFAK